MNEVWLRPLVWMDYRLALIVTVILPLVLLIWSIVGKAEALQRLMIIYWRVASLLLITVYLMIPGWWFGFLTGLTAKILIPLSLWFWVDINDEIRDYPASWLKLVVTAWRWAITGYTMISAIAMLPFMSCAFTPGEIKTPVCQVWLEAPRLYHALFHKNSSAGFLGFLGTIGLCFYVVYFAYFLLIRLGKQGRIAMEN